MQAVIAAFVAGCLLAGLVTFGVVTDYKDAKFSAYVETAKSAREKSLREATEKTLAAERAFSQLKDSVEKDHAEAQSRLVRAVADARRDVAARGLRDPGARRACPNPVPANPQSAAVDHGAAEGGLSAEATDFLLTLASEADSAVIQLEACQAWARSIGGVTHD